LSGNAVSLSAEEVATPEPERIDRRRAALIAYDVCRRALAPSDPARRAAMRPVLDAWVRMIAAARAAGVPVIYMTPVSRADGADVVMLPTDLSAETSVPPLTNALEGTAEAGFPEIAPGAATRPPTPKPRQGDENVRAHPQPRLGRGDAAGMSDHRTLVQNCAPERQ
jgi:nicotinamidase-related amidase